MKDNELININKCFLTERIYQWNKFHTMHNFRPKHYKLIIIDNMNKY